MPEIVVTFVVLAIRLSYHSFPCDYCALSFIMGHSAVAPLPRYAAGFGSVIIWSVPIFFQSSLSINPYGTEEVGRGKEGRRGVLPYYPWGQ